MLDIWGRLDALEPVQRPKRAVNAVLVPLYRDDSEDVRVILTKRPEHMRRHPGDVVFPGGRMEDGEQPEDTAIREACEEIGLPDSAVDVVGGLTPVSTPRPEEPHRSGRGSRATTGRTRSGTRARSRRSSSRRCLTSSPMRTGARAAGSAFSMWFYEFDEGTLWGATGFVMRELISILRDTS